MEAADLIVSTIIGIPTIWLAWVSIKISSHNHNESMAYQTKLQSQNMLQPYIEYLARIKRDCRDEQDKLLQITERAKSDIVHRVSGAAIADPSLKPLSECYVGAISFIKNASTCVPSINYTFNSVFEDIINVGSDYKDATANNHPRPAFSVFLTPYAQAASTTYDTDIMRFELDIKNLFDRIVPQNYQWLLQSCSKCISEYNHEHHIIVDRLREMDKSVSDIMHDIDHLQVDRDERDAVERLARSISDPIARITHAGFPAVLVSDQDDTCETPSYPWHASVMAIAYAIYLGTHLQFIESCSTLRSTEQ